jgi:hypothetical protein
VLPPRCELCGRKARQDDGRPFGGYSLVQFADHQPEETGGLSSGLSWFCPTHTPSARALTDLPRAAALTRLRADYASGQLQRPRRGLFRRRG